MLLEFESEKKDWFTQECTWEERLVLLGFVDKGS